MDIAASPGAESNLGKEPSGSKSSMHSPNWIRQTTLLEFSQPTNYGRHAAIFQRELPGSGGMGKGRSGNLPTVSIFVA